MLQIIIESVVTILGGILAASGFFLARIPSAKQLIDKLVPYQGGIGLALFGWGIWGVIDLISNIEMLKIAPDVFIIVAVAVLVNLLVGILLGFGLIAKYAFGKNEQAVQKGEKMLQTLVKIQAPLGFLSIGVGLLFVLSSFGFFLIGCIAGALPIIAYVVLVLVMGNPKSDGAQGAATSTNSSSKKQSPAPAVASKNGPFYETTITNVTCTPEGTSYKIGMKITAKKFVIDPQTKKEKEVLINNDIQIGMMKDGKEIYLRNYKFTKTITTLTLVMAQKPDKIGIDPYNLLPEKAQLN